MSAKVNKKFKDLFDKIKDTLNTTIRQDQMASLAQFTADLIVKRTLLGYGVDKQFAPKSKLNALSKKYVTFRTKFKTLSDKTTPKKSNLTLTGQMLASVSVIKVKNGSVQIGPTGKRTDSKKTNLQIAQYNQEKGRTFNRVSDTEKNQVLREFRRTFGDLLKKKRLIT